MGLESIGSSPMFPILMFKLDHIHFINHLKINTARRNFFFETIVNKKVLEFIRLIYRLNIIRRYIRLTNKTYRIYPAWSGCAAHFKSIKCYRPNNNPIIVSYKALLILQNHTGVSDIILSTPRGILTQREAIKFRTGGILMCMIC